MLIENFSIDDGDSSKNVTFKMNSRLFKLCRAYFNFLNDVGEFPWELISWGPHSSFEREKKIVVACHSTFSIKREIRDFHAVVFQ